MGEVIIPLGSAKSLDDAADYLLKNRCKQMPEKGQRTAYKAGMKAKGINNTLDLRKKDLRWWPFIRQEWSRVIVISEKDLPQCPAVEEPKKIEVKPAQPASQPIIIKPIEIKPETVPVQIPTKVKPVKKPPVKKEGKSLIP